MACLSHGRCARVGGPALDRMGGVGRGPWTAPPDRRREQRLLLNKGGLREPPGRRPALCGWSLAQEQGVVDQRVVTQVAEFESCDLVGDRGREKILAAATALRSN